MIRVLTTYPSADASRRLRIDPLVEELRARGRDVRIHELMTGWMYARKNAGTPVRALVALLLGARLAARLVILARRSEVLIVHREAFPFLTPLGERLAARRAGLAVLDVDDAVYAPPTHRADWRRFARDPRRAAGFARVFDLILCGNESLAEWFGGGRAQTRLAYTCPPSTTPMEKLGTASTGVLWTGSQSTLPSLTERLPEILTACEALGLTLTVLGGANIAELPSHPLLRAERWTAAREEQALRGCGVGLMPLPDTEWERGKSGFKALLYLAAGMVAVVSPVGINAEIIARHRNVISDTGGWKRALSDAIRRYDESDARVADAREARARYNGRRQAAEVADEILARSCRVA